MSQKAIQAIYQNYSISTPGISALLYFLDLQPRRICSGPSIDQKRNQTETTGDEVQSPMEAKQELKT